MKGSSLYLAKRGCNEITSSFVDDRTNMLPQFSLVPAEGG